MDIGCNILMNFIGKIDFGNKWCELWQGPHQRDLRFFEFLIEATSNEREMFVWTASTNKFQMNIIIYSC